jgi:DNA-binding transcriptional LysR family regulator
VTLLLLLHDWQHRGYSVQDALKVHIDHPVPFFDLESIDRCDGHNPGVIYDHIDSPKTVDRRSDESFHFSPLRYVNSDTSALHDVRYEELFHERVCVAVALQHPFARRRAIPITEVAAEPLIGLTREDYPNFYDYLSILFSKVKQKPRVVEEHDSFSAVMSAVEAGTGVAIATDFGYSFGNRLKFLHITPEPKPISVGIVGTKGRLSPAAEKFWQCAKEAASKK